MCRYQYSSCFSLRLKVAPMAPTLYTARYLLPITAPPISDGALLVDNARILEVGSRTRLAEDYPGAEMVDFGDAVLLPPMVNAHTHLELTDFPAWAESVGASIDSPGFVEWILRLIRVRRSVDTGLLRASLVSGLTASLRAGTGAVGDILTTLDVRGVYRDTPLLGKVYAEVLGQGAADVEKRLTALEAEILEAPAATLCWGLSPHAPYTLSATAMQRTFAFAFEHGLQASIHLAESNEETAFVKSGTGPIAETLYASAQWDSTADPVSGNSPVKGLCQRGRLRAGDLVVHGVQVDDEDVALIQEKGCHVVLCPRSNATLEVGVAPVAAYLKAGVPLALGTDSMASAPSLSLWDELAFAQEWFKGQASPQQWLEIATLGGAKALGLHHRIGALSVGLDASFQVVAMPELPALDGLEDSLCCGAGQVSVSHLFLSGRNVLPKC